MAGATLLRLEVPAWFVLAIEGVPRAHQCCCYTNHDTISAKYIAGLRAESPNSAAAAAVAAAPAGPPPRRATSPPLTPSCRRPKELRQLKAQLDVLSTANGSALFEMGNTKVLAAVFGPKPTELRSQEDEKRAIIRCEYAMAAFSTGTGVHNVGTPPSGVRSGQPIDVWRAGGACCAVRDAGW